MRLASVPHPNGCANRHRVQLHDFVTGALTQRGKEAERRRRAEAAARMGMSDSRPHTGA